MAKFLSRAEFQPFTRPVIRNRPSDPTGAASALPYASGSFCPSLTADVLFDVLRLPHARDHRADVGMLQDVPQRQLPAWSCPSGTTGAQPLDPLERRRQILGLEVDVAEVPFRPRRVGRQRAGEAAFVERHARDHRDVLLAAGREQLVLGALIEEVVDDLDRVDEPGVERPQDVRRLPAVDADADRAARVLLPSARRPPAASCRRSPRCRSRRGTAAGRRVETPRFVRLFSVYSRM